MIRDKLRKDWAELKKETQGEEFKAGMRKLKLALWFLLSVIVLVAVAAGILSIKRELPPELRGQLHASGRVVSRATFIH